MKYHRPTLFLAFFAINLVATSASVAFKPRSLIVSNAQPEGIREDPVTRYEISQRGGDAGSKSSLSTAMFNLVKGIVGKLDYNFGETRLGFY